MYVGTLRLRLIIHAAESLKDRRRSVKALIARLRNEFNAAAADLDEQPVADRALVGIACVSNDPRHLDAQLQKIVGFVEAIHLDIEVVEEEMEIVRL